MSTIARKRNGSCRPSVLERPQLFLDAPAKRGVARQVPGSLEFHARLVNAPLHYEHVGETGVGKRYVGVLPDLLADLPLRQELLGIQSLGSGCLGWADYDGDGDHDLAMAGMSDLGPVARVYADDGTGHFEWDGQVLVGVERSSVDWGDYDGDGAPDLVLTGFEGGDRWTVFYENDPPGILNDTGDHGLPPANLSDTEWGDYDGNGDLDLALTGCTAMTGPDIAKVYENDGTGVFTEVADLLPLYRSSVAWGDYDLDGDLDLALCGYDGVGLYTVVYENTGTGFVDSGFQFPGMYEGALCWCDVDGDCDPDLFMVGGDWSNKYAVLYENLCFPTGVTNGSEMVPDGVGPILNANYPNPFNPTTTVRYFVSEPGRVSLAVYFCKLTAGGAADTKKMILVK